MAERGGFEPPCPLLDKTLSRRPRYDHFGTSPQVWPRRNGPFIIACGLSLALARSTWSDTFDVRWYATGGWVLVGLFAARVIAQPLSLVVGGLPTFESWHSAALPYSLLLLSQLVILAILSWSTYRVSIGAVNPGRSFGAIALSFGAVYFLVMIARLVLGLTIFSNIRWFASPLPTVFHLVLASWLLLYGHLHWTLGLRTRSTR